MPRVEMVLNLFRLDDLEGRLDSVDEDLVSGWLLHRARRDGPWSGGEDVDIVCDGELVCRVRADQPRPDVRQHFSSTAACGFAFRLPPAVCRAKTSVDVFAVRRRWRLPGSPLPLADRDIWAIGTEKRSIVPTASGIEERTLDTLSEPGSGYTVCRAAGRMETPLPTVLPAEIAYSVQAPDVYGPEGRRFLASSAYPDMSVAKLDGAICLPRGLLITSSGSVIDECFQSRRERTFHHELDIDGDHCALKAKVPIVRRSRARVLWIDHQHMNHYGHFITDVMSKLWAYPLLRDRGLKVLVSDTTQWWIFKILELYGVGRERIFVLKEPTAFEAVYVPTRAMQLYEYVSPLFFPIGHAVARHVADVEPSRGKYFLSRRRQGRRSLVNEDIIEGLFRSHGYTIVVPEEVPIGEQIALFATATSIAGCSGSALYSVIYGRHIESLIVLASPDLIIKSEQLLFAYAGRSLRLVVGDRLPHHADYVSGEVHNPWHIDPSLVRRVLVESDPASAHGDQNPA